MGIDLFKKSALLGKELSTLLNACEDIVCHILCGFMFGAAKVGSFRESGKTSLLDAYVIFCTTNSTVRLAGGMFYERLRALNGKNLCFFEGDVIV